MLDTIYCGKEVKNMVGTALLEVYIKDSGLKKSNIAERLGISRQSFSNKLSYKRPFTLGEMRKLVEILEIKSSEDIVKIFLS